MPRAVDGRRRTQRRKKILSRAKGFRGARSKLFRVAKDAIAKADQYAYRDRRVRKRDFRKLWITRLAAASQQHGLRYSQFIAALRKANIEINRKMLSNMAIEDPQAFAELVNTLKK